MEWLNFYVEVEKHCTYNIDVTYYIERNISGGLGDIYVYPLPVKAMPFRTRAFLS